MTELEKCLLFYLLGAGSASVVILVLACWRAIQVLQGNNDLADT